MPTAGSPLPYHDHPFTEKGRGEVHQHRPEMSGRGQGVGGCNLAQRAHLGACR